MDKKISKLVTNYPEVTQDELSMEELNEVIGGGAIIHDSTPKGVSGRKTSQSQIKLGQDKSIIGVL